MISLVYEKITICCNEEHVWLIDSTFLAVENGIKIPASYYLFFCLIQPLHNPLRLFNGNGAVLKIWALNIKILCINRNIINNIFNKVYHF